MWHNTTPGKVKGNVRLNSFRQREWLSYSNELGVLEKIAVKVGCEVIMNMDKYFTSRRWSASGDPVTG